MHALRRPAKICRKTAVSSTTAAGIRSYAELATKKLRFATIMFASTDAPRRRAKHQTMRAASSTTDARKRSIAARALRAKSAKIMRASAMRRLASRSHAKQKEKTAAPSTTDAEMNSIAARAPTAKLAWETFAPCRRAPQQHAPAREKTAVR